jgi:16S rRNA (adenine1518-N6/adenine1519-N6)-dimethyltransferase
MTNNIPAKKSLGQNWLVNEGVLDRIVQAASVDPGDTILEIGPGQGALTGRLAATGAKVIAVEKDRRLIETLKEQFSTFPNVQIIEGDVLKLEPSAYGLTPDSYKVVANIPYYLTSHLIRLILESWPSPTLAVLMVQEEVAHRMMAKPPEMNLLALSVQLYATPEIIMKVSRGSFRPIPNVDSAVVRLTPHTANREEAEKILTLAKQFFSHKRKQMKTGPNPSARPQELSLEDWKRLIS